MTSPKVTPDDMRVNLASLPLWPSFSEGHPDIDGLIPACRVESWEAFIAAMRDPSQNRAASEWVYRGQRGGDWPLASTLGRKFNGGSIPDVKRRALLREFELAMRGRGYDLSGRGGDTEEIEKWAIGQHHGLLTPLLDWTRSPFIALFFAFNTADKVEENPSRAVYCVNMSALREAFDGEGMSLFHDPMGHNNSRLVNQAGLFTMVPDADDNFASYVINRLIEEQVVTAELTTRPVAGSSATTSEAVTDFDVRDNLAEQLRHYIRKIHIPNIGRSECLAMLRKMNIHNGTLFPDAQGASLYCNDWLLRVIEEEQKEKAEEEQRAAAARQTMPKVDARALAESPVEDVQAVADILASLLPSEFEPSARDEFARSLHNRFEQDRALDWQISNVRTAKIKTGQRRLMATFGFPEEVRETLIDKLIEFYSDRSKRKADR